MNFLAKESGAVALTRRWLRRASTFRTVTILVHRFASRTIPSDDADLRAVTAHNLEDAASMDDPARIAEFGQFLARGDAGLYGYRQGRVVHRSWRVRGPTSAALWHSYGRLDVAGDEAYIHYCETAPDARGLGLYPRALARLAETALEEGARRVLIWTTRDNVTSLRGIERAGFVPAYEIDLAIRFGMARQSVRAPRRTPGPPLG